MRAHSELHKSKTEAERTQRSLKEADLLWSSLVKPEEGRRSVFIVRDDLKVVQQSSPDERMVIPAGSELFIPCQAVRLVDNDQIRERVSPTFRCAFLTPDGRRVWVDPTDEIIFPDYAMEKHIPDSESPSAKSLHD